MGYWLRLSGPFLAVAAGLIIVSGAQIIRGVDFVTGDIWDGRIMVSLLEHWWNALRGLEAPVRPIYFYPFKTTLAYNDGNLITGLVYSAPRALGADPFLAYEVTNWIVRSVGGLGMIALARAFGLPAAYALASGVLLMISSNIVIRMSHAQLLFVGMAPWGFLLFGHALRSFARPDPRLSCYLAAVAFALFAWAWAMTAFYSLFGFGLILIAFLLFCLLLSSELRGCCRRAITRRPDAVVLSVALIAVAVASVLSVYKASGQSHLAADMRAYAGAWSNAVNLGTGGLWSMLAYGEVDPRHLATFNGTYGLTPILLATYLTGIAWLAVKARTPVEKIALGLSLAALLIGCLAFRTGDIVHWEPFFRYFPGAQAVRVPVRLLLSATPIVILMAVFTASRLPPVLGAIVLALIGIEQIGTYRPFMIDRHREVAFLASIPPKPDYCKHFFISRPRFDPSENKTIDTHYAAGVDAMIIAHTRQIPTINGIATVQPRGWDLLDPFDSTYRGRALAYADRMGVRSGLCSLDLKAMTWAAEDR